MDNKTPQLEDGYVKIANEIFDHLCWFRIPGELRLIVDVIIRKTYGWNKKEDWIAQSQLVEKTKRSKGNVSRSLSKLITNRIVIKTDNKLKLNKNLNEWVSFNKLSKLITNKKLSKLISPVIRTDTKVIRSEGNKIHYTKDTNTKNNNTFSIIKREFGNPDINELISYFKITLGLPIIDGSIQKNRMYANLCIKKFGSKDKVKILIDSTKVHKFWSTRITSFMDLYNKGVNIISSGRDSTFRPTEIQV